MTTPPNVIGDTRIFQKIHWRNPSKLPSFVLATLLNKTEFQKFHWRHPKSAPATSPKSAPTTSLSLAARAIDGPVESPKHTPKSATKKIHGERLGRAKIYFVNIYFIISFEKYYFASVATPEKKWNTVSGTHSVSRGHSRTHSKSAPPGRR